MSFQRPPAGPEALPPEIAFLLAEGVAGRLLVSTSSGRLDTGTRGLPDTGGSPGATVLIRVAIAAVVVLPLGLVSLRGRWGLLRRNTGLVVTYGVLAVAGAQFCYFSAVQYMQVGPALLIEYTAPAAVVVWLWLRHGQRPGPLADGRDLAHDHRHRCVSRPVARSGRIPASTTGKPVRPSCQASSWAPGRS